MQRSRICFTFLDMYKTSRVEDLDMYHKWLENRTYESMRSLIGQKAGEQPRFIWISMKNTMVPTVWWLVLQEAESQKHCRPIF